MCHDPDEESDSGDETDAHKDCNGDRGLGAPLHMVWYATQHTHAHVSLEPSAKRHTVCKRHSSPTVPQATWTWSGSVMPPRQRELSFQLYCTKRSPVAVSHSVTDCAMSSLVQAAMPWDRAGVKGFRLVLLSHFSHCADRLCFH